MPDPFSRDRFNRPERFLDEFLRKGAKGIFVERGEGLPVFYRALVIGVDVQGGKLENADGSGKIPHNFNGKSYDVPARVGPDNPPGSIKARVLTDGLDRFQKDEDLRVFWPLFPDGAPCKPGEHVYVVFEDSQMTHGLWVTRVPGHTGDNYAPGENFYDSSLNQPQAAKRWPDTSSAAGSQDDNLNSNEAASETEPGNSLSALFGNAS